MKRLIMIAVAATVLIACRKDTDPQVPEQPQQPEQPNPDTIIAFNKLYGGTARDNFLVAHVTPNQGYFLGGVTYSIDGDIMQAFGFEDIWILKLDSAGNKVWAKTYGGTSDETIVSITGSPDGGLVIAATTGSARTFYNGGYPVPWLFKLDDDGNIVWEKTISNFLFRVAAVKLTSIGDYIGCGTANGHPWVFRLDRNGNMIWEKTYETRAGAAWMIDESAEGDFVVGGGVEDTVYSSSNMRAFKVDGEGNFMWSKEFGGSGGTTV